MPFKDFLHNERPFAFRSCSQNTRSLRYERNIQYQSNISMRPGTIERLRDWEGELDRAVQAGEWRFSPHTRLVGPALTWVFLGTDNFQTARPQRGMLESFLNLANGPDAKILAFARRFGHLRICTHGLPWEHNPLRFAPVGFCRLLHLEKLTFWEPLELWRGFSREAAAILQIAALLADDKVSDAELWNQILSDAVPPAADIRPEIVAQRRGLRYVLDRILKRGDVRPRLRWQNGTATVVFGGPGLYGALAVQILLAASITGGFAICAACGEYYTPKRRPASNRRAYCPECVKASKRDAQRDYAARLSKAKALLRDGKPPEEILNAVTGIRPATLKKLLGKERPPAKRGKRRRATSSRSGHRSTRRGGLGRSG